MAAKLALTCATWLAAAALAVAQTSYPMITHTHPVAVQRGKTTEVTVEGTQNFAGAYAVLFADPDITGEVVVPKGKGKKSSRAVRRVPIRLTPKPDALPGVRDFRIITPLGASSIGQVLVVSDPVTVESAKNNSRDQATAVTLPCTICGKIETAEDVDWYRFHVDAGQVVTAEVFCARIEDRIHDLQKHGDPLIAFYDASGRELASNDDFYFADPLLSYEFDKAGDYYLQVRDSKYDGDRRWVYAVCLTNQPYVTTVYPLALTAGKSNEVEVVGPAHRVQAKAQVSVPADTAPGITRLPLQLAGHPTNPVTFVVTPYPPIQEKEPNDSPDQANRVPIPCCINGRIGRRRDLDHFVFSAKKGQAIQFEVKARRFGTSLISGLDASLDVLDMKGKVLASGDDISPAIKDAQVTFKPPADGDYVLRVRDLLSKGGEQYVYAVEACPVAPDFALRCDNDKANLAPGVSVPWYVHVTRRNGFNGPVKVVVEGLPKGVSANSLVIPPTMKQGLLVLTASKEAPRGFANVRVVGTAEIERKGQPPLRLRRIATPNQEIYLPGGGRGLFDVTPHTVCVTERADILRVEVKPTRISLRPGQEAKITVKLHRHPDYKKNVTLDVRLRHLSREYGNPLPPGVTVVDGKSKTLLGKGNDGHIVLKAAANAAPIRDVPISVIANVSINFVVKISYSSEPIRITVLPGKQARK